MQMLCESYFGCCYFKDSRKDLGASCKFVQFELTAISFSDNAQPAKDAPGLNTSLSTMSLVLVDST